MIDKIDLFSNTISEFKKAKNRAENRAKQIGLEVFLTMPKSSKNINNKITEIITEENKNVYKKLDDIKIPLKIIITIEIGILFQIFFVE